MSDALASIPAEEQVIGCTLARGELAPECEDLRPEDFHLPAHRDIWRCVLALRRRESQLDPVTVADEMTRQGLTIRLEGGDGYLLRLGNQAWGLPVAPAADVVREKASLRALVALGGAIVAGAREGARADELIATARLGLSDVELRGASTGPAHVRDVLPTTLEAIEARARGSAERTVSSGIGAFDRIIGGFRPGRLIVVAGTPGMGKSSSAGGIAVHNALRGVPSLVFSLEMERDELTERFLSSLSRVPASDLGVGKLDYSQWKHVQGAAARLEGASLWLDDRDLTLARILGEARRWHAREVGVGNPGLLVVDYLGLIKSEERAQNREREVANMTRAFKGLAKSLKVPVILLSQLSREHAKQGKRPENHDLRDSGAIESDADMTIFMWREFPKDADGADMVNAPGPAEWLVRKNRGGKKGMIPVYWHGETMTFTDLEEET